MSVLKHRSAPADTLARWAWIAMALTPVGWVIGMVLAFLTGEGWGAGPVIVGLLGIFLFAAAPATAVVLAVKAARAGHRSGRIAVAVSGSLLAVAALCLPLLFGLIGLVVTAVVAVLVFVWARPRNKASPRGPNGAQREGGSSAAHAPPGAAGRTS